MRDVGTAVSSGRAAPFGWLVFSSRFHPRLSKAEPGVRRIVLAGNILMFESKKHIGQLSVADEEVLDSSDTSN